jgi:hypothetical protein
MLLGAGCLSVPAPPGPGGDLDASVPADCDPLGPFAPLSDDFESGVLSWGTVGQSDGSSNVVHWDTGALVFVPSGVRVDYSWVKSNDAFDFTQGTIQAEILSMPPADLTSLEVWFGLKVGENDLAIYQSDGELRFPDRTRVLFDPVAHRFLRLHSDECGLIFDASPDGETWTRLAAIQPPDGLEAARFEVGLGTHGEETGELGELALDNLNIPPTTTEIR